MEKTIFLKKDIEVLIVSAGGVGTTFLIDAISKYKKTNCSSNTDGYKHLPIPPISSNRNLKVVYVFGDPIMASLSLFRRNYHHTQSVWATKFQQHNYIISETTTVEDYGKNKRDGHYFEIHLENWKERYLCYPTLFLRYENIHDSLDGLGLFLDLPSSFIQSFPEKKERKSSVKNISDEGLLGLQKMYGEYQKKINKYSDFFIAHPRKTIYNNAFTKEYRRALKDSFYKKIPFFRKVKNKIWR